MTEKPAPQPKAVEPGAEDQNTPARPREIGGPKWLDPTRYGDWERKGIVSDF